ncbi:hypothetical protein [Pseudenterobacter timonensis]|uniref:Outer membrane protein n=1 Tax=Pseudenterobacter timonensis TaxID=1755099 RepID=A0ABV4A9P3_9ENTR
MKRHGQHLLMTFSLVAALFTSAAWSADDCQITFSSPDVSFGRFKQDEEVSVQQSWHQMPSREINVSVNCPESQTMAFFVQAPAGEKGRFYFGDSSGLAVRASQMVVDGKPYAIARTIDRTQFTADGDAQQSQLLRNNNGVIAMDNHQQVSGKQMNLVLTLTPVLSDRQFNHVGDTVTLESDLMWEVLTK